MTNQVNTNQERQKIEAEYPSVIHFSLDGAYPRSSNIVQARWGGDGNLFVEFVGYQRKDGSISPNTGYVYTGVPVTVWQDICGGEKAVDLYPNEEHRRSSGRVFYRRIRVEKMFTDYRKVF